ncbi:Hcp family type VI secretion system effector [Pseudomonas sp. B21-012]|uniref:Hcp family type VI secretion system effector n=1 Tax=Pseudomonas sp. B21-012 TaxID=2895472 RepID=UPI00215EDE47|nr:Hcp family type VI secretion system effector [Pseudomonas sp. B21-012]UVM55143.1 Hcp family type VI secretion system effector [Pseudomonas sp. B21-012]
MANHGYMTITGRQQGLISAGCSTADSMGNKYQSGHCDEIMVLAYSHNLSNLGNTQNATHRPIVISKNIDKASPLLAQALANREELKCLINFFRISSSGHHEKYYTIELRGGMVVDLRIDVPHAVLQHDMNAQAHLAIRYRDIFWTHHLAGTSGHAFWGDEQWSE